MSGQRPGPLSQHWPQNTVLLCSIFSVRLFRNKNATEEFEKPSLSEGPWVEN